MPSGLVSGMIRTLILSVLCLVLAAAAAPLPSHAATKAGVEAEFRQWLEADLWPEAKRSGVSRSVFERAFSGVDLDWDLPDLAPPGFPSPRAAPRARPSSRAPAPISAKRACRDWPRRAGL